MKVLFLDIDGVCNCRNTTARTRGFIGIDEAMAKIVRQIIDDTGCKIVLSSTWRLNAKSRKEVKEKVADFIDVTKSIGIGYRGMEVKEWLSRHSEVTKYAIVDDDRDFYPNQPLFKTTFETGITIEIAKQITEYLK